MTTATRLLFFLREMRGIGRNEARKAIVLLFLVAVRDRNTQEAVDRRRAERAASEMQRRGSGYLSLPLRKEGRTDGARKGYDVDRQGAPPKKKKKGIFFKTGQPREKCMYVDY